jgi:hypothetical protein
MKRQVRYTWRVFWMAGPIVGNRPPSPLSPYHYQYVTVTNWPVARAY